MIKKHEIALFVDKSATSTPNYVRLCKSTELTLSMEAQTEEYDYIADENPTTELESYNPQIEQALKMIKGEPDFDFFWEKFYNMATGEDAKVGGMIIFKFDSEEVGNTTYYRAWKPRFTIVYNEMNCNDSELNFNLNTAGTVEKGYATIENGVVEWHADISD